MLQKTAFGVAYYGTDNNLHSTDVVFAADHWEACGLALRALPDAADDFHVIEDAAAIIDGPFGIAGAAREALRNLKRLEA